MNSIPKEQQPDLIAAARIARAGEPDDPWTKIADFFDAQRQRAEDVIEPRDTRRETPNK